MVTSMTKVNNFQIANVQPHGVASFCLFLLQFQPGVAYKRVAYKKKRIVLTLWICV